MDIKDKAFRARIANLLENITNGTDYEIEKELKDYLKSLVRYDRLSVKNSSQIKYCGRLITTTTSSNTPLEWHNRNLDRSNINYFCNFQLELFVKLLRTKQIELPDLFLLSCIAIEILYPEMCETEMLIKEFNEKEIEKLPLEIRKKLNFYNHNKPEIKSEGK